MAVRSGSSIAAECKAASINSPKGSEWPSTKSRRRKAREQQTSVRNRDRTPLTPLNIVLFDIDGTLILTGGAGGRAMSRAFEEVFGIARAFDGVPMAGRTDRRILDNAAARAGLVLDDEARRRFRDRYFDCLLEALQEPAHPKRVLPGVLPLLEALTSPPLAEDIVLALLTGNCEQGARLKLEYFDLWRFFRCGAFGDDTHDRNDLFSVAMQRAKDCGFPGVAPERVIVVGDTELDVACAAAAGARSVAVATGPSSAGVLRESGAEVVLEDLSNTNGFLALLDRG